MKFIKYFLSIIYIISPLLLFSQTPDQNLKPNIIIIISDDAGYADFSMHGSKQFPTPNIDGIAKEGVLFTQGYVSASVCSPSRAGILTGRYQQRFGHEYNIGSHQPSDDPEYIGMRSDQITLADVLRKLGYKTAAIGKWHLGELDKYHPLNRGFDEFFGMREGGARYFGQGLKVFRIERGMEKVNTALPYLTDAFGAEACDFIKRNKDKPFFLYLSFNAVHTPMQAKEEDKDMFNFIENDGRRTLGGMTLALDKQVGEVLRTLKKEGLEKNTLVWFINDNGGQVTSNKACNAPLNGKKGTLLEGGIRVPFCVKWPDGIPKGIIYNQAVSSLDIFTTSITATGNNAQNLVNEMAKEKIPEEWQKVQKRRRPVAGEGWQLDGVNLISYINKTSTGNPHDKLYWRRAKAAAIRDGELKLIRLPDRPPLLYNLSNDISEQNNIAIENQIIVEKLMKELFEWETQLAHPAWRTEPYWIKNNTLLYDQEYLLTQPEK